MVWRKAAVSARKAEDHAERRRPINQPRGLNRRESAPFDSARRRGLLLPKSYPLARKAVVEKEDLLDIPLILLRRVGLQQEIAHWAQIEIERLHVAATYNVLVGDPSAVVQSGLGYLLITDDHLPEPLEPAPLLPPALPFPGNSPRPCPETLRRLYQSRRRLSPSRQVPSRIRQNAP